MTSGTSAESSSVGHSHNTVKDPSDILKEQLFSLSQTVQDVEKLAVSIKAHDLIAADAVDQIM